MIETCKRVIRQIEDEINTLTGACNKLEEAESRIDQRERLLSGKDEMLQSVKRVGSVGTGLRIVDAFEDDMCCVISGNQMESVMDGLRELISDIDSEKQQKREKISRLKAQLQELWGELEDLLRGGEENA